MGKLRPNLSVLDAGYMPGAFLTADGILTLVRRDVSGSAPSKDLIEKIQVSHAAASVEVVNRQLTVLPWFAWVLGGVVITLVINLSLWAFQYASGRRSLTGFILHLRDGRTLTLRADKEVLQEMRRQVAMSARSVAVGVKSAE